MTDVIDIEKLQQLEQAEALKRKILSLILTKEAYERLSRVRFANPTLASQVEMYLINLYQSGRLTKNVTDEQLKQILRVLSEKKDFKIRKM